MDTLLAKLSEQQALLAKQKTALSHGSDEENHPQEISPVSSTLLTPATETFARSNTGSEQGRTARAEAAEMARLKKELDDAKNQIARQKQELDQSRVIKHTFDQAMGPPSDAALSPPVEHFNNSYPANSRQAWGPLDDARSEVSEYKLPTNLWSSNRARDTLQPDTSWGQQGSRPWSQRGLGNPPVAMMAQQQPTQQRNYSVPLSPVLGGHGRGLSEFSQFNSGRGYGQFNAQANRNATSFQSRGSGYGGYSGTLSSSEAINPTSAFQSVGMYPSGYQPQPIGTPLSPTAAEFRAGQVSANPWNAAVSHSPFSISLSPKLIGTTKASHVPRTDLCLSHGASQLSSPPRSICHLQLEVHCG